MTTTIFLYTNDDQGGQFAESPVIGMISDIVGTRKLVVVRDPASNIDYVYKISPVPNNLDAVSLSQLSPTDFADRKRIVLDGDTHKLAPAPEAMKLLNGQTYWIQDKGSMLSVLVHSAALGPMKFVARTINRPRITDLPSPT